MDEATRDSIARAFQRVGQDMKAGGVSSPFFGQKGVFFGDSIVELGNWPQQVGTMLGMAAVNAGFGGCRMAQHTGDPNSALYDKMSMYQLAGMVQSGDFSTLITAANDLYAATGDDNRATAAAVAAVNWNDVDVIGISYGTNDFAGAVPIGADGDSTGATFKGALNLSLSRILTAYPHIRVFTTTPLWRMRSENRDSDTSGQGGQFLFDFGAAIQSRSRAYKTPSLDLYYQSGINVLTNAYYLTDGTHPTASGFELIARKVAGFMRASL
jgi:lysophospholipase L1-like esterase